MSTSISPNSWRSRWHLVAVVVTSATLTGCMPALLGHRVEGRFVRELAVSGPVSVELDTGSGDIEIKTTDAGPVRIQGWVSIRSFWNDDDDDLRAIQQAPPIEQRGDEIRIGGGQQWHNVRISYVLTVPRSTRLRVRTGSGDVQVDDINGSVDARTGSGDMSLGRIGSSLRGVTGSGDIDLAAGLSGVELRTGSGDVLVGALGDQSAEVTTGSGDVEVHRASAALRVRTGSGRIAAEGSPIDQWDLQANSGDIDVGLPPSAAFSVDARTSSGEIDVDGLTRSRRGSRRRVEGSVRGGGPLLSMSTGSGQITVR